MQTISINIDHLIDHMIDEEPITHEERLFIIMLLTQAREDRADLNHAGETLQ